MNASHLVCFALVFCASWLPPIVSRASQVEDETAIRKNDDAYVAAYNRHDAKAIAAMWSPEAVYMEPDTGEAAGGREAIGKEVFRTFAELKDAQLAIEVQAIQFVAAHTSGLNDVAP